MTPLGAVRVVRYYPRAAIGDGGMTGAVARWAEATTRLGAPTTILHDGGSAPTGGAAAWANLPHRGPRTMRVPIGLASALASADVLVVHSGWTAHGVVAGAAARSAGVPYLLEPRGAYDPHIVVRRRLAKRLWWLAAERRLVEGAAGIHVFYEQEREHLAQLGYGGPVIIVPNGTAYDGDAAWRGGAGHLLFLGRFDVEHKGIDRLVEAVATLAPGDRPRIRLHGPDRREGGGVARAVDLIRRHRVGDWVQVGPQLLGAAKREALLSCEGFVYPSRWDACPNAVLEAVGLGVPTVTTPYPLARAIAANGGLVLADDSVRGLAFALRDVGSRPDRAAMGARGAAMVRQEHAWPRVASQWLDQVDAVLRGRCASQPGSSAVEPGGVEPRYPAP